jgi:hypothetical protein
VILVGVDVKKFDAGPEMIHQLPQCPRRHCPVMRSLILIELCMHRNSGLEREMMSRREAISKNNAGNESALDSLAVFYRHITSLNECLPFGISLAIDH